MFIIGSVIGFLPYFSIYYFKNQIKFELKMIFILPKYCIFLLEIHVLFQFQMVGFLNYNDKNSVLYLFSLSVKFEYNFALIIILK